MFRLGIEGRNWERHFGVNRRDRGFGEEDREGGASGGGSIKCDFGFGSEREDRRFARGRKRKHLLGASRGLQTSQSKDLYETIQPYKRLRSILIL